MKKILFKSVSVLTITILLSSGNVPHLVYAQEQTTEVDQEKSVSKIPKAINLLIGDVETIEAKNITRVAVTNPDMVDISDAQANEVTLVGKKAGQTEVFIWDDNGKTGINVSVAIQNLDVLKARIQEVLEKAQIKGISLDKNAYEGKVVLYGAVSKEDKLMLDRILDPFLDKIINLVKESVNEDSVQIDAQIVEVTTNVDKKLGIDWSELGATTLQPTYAETIPVFDGSVGDFFKIGDFSRTTALQAKLNILINEGKARIISKPRLVVKSGKEASFLVGGQIPITTTSTSGGGAGTSTSSVSFKQYGVNMTVTPTVREGKIDVILTVKITDIDQSNRVGNDVAYTSREAQTQLYLDNKQTIILAGLIKHNDSNNVRKVSFLGDVPILGLLFRSRNTPTSDTEMVISLTPRIIKSSTIATEQTKMPTKKVEHFSNEFEKGFERESIKDEVRENLKPKVVEKIKPVETVDVKKDVKPVVLASSQVPSMIVLDYVRAVQVKISQAISFPKEALEQNWEGTSKLRLRILKDGSLADCDLLESSGHDVFDLDVQKTTKALSPFLAFPEDMQQEDIVITVPIVFNRHANSKDTQAVVPSY